MKFAEFEPDERIGDYTPMGGKSRKCHRCGAMQTLVPGKQPCTAFWRGPHVRGCPTASRTRDDTRREARKRRREQAKARSKREARAAIKVAAGTLTFVPLAEKL